MGLLILGAVLLLAGNLIRAKGLGGIMGLGRKSPKKPPVRQPQNVEAMPHMKNMVIMSRMLPLGRAFIRKKRVPSTMSRP